MSKIVAIVGRPNVGKSTLFNRLVGERKAIVDDESGVTRDRHYGKAEWRDRQFVLIDTGGFVSGSDDIFEDAIRTQVKIAIEEANLLLFMVDVTNGITDLDISVADLLRKSQKPVFVVVNKVDNFNREMETAEFYALGFKSQFHVSSASGSGTGELLDAVYETLELEKEEPANALQEIAGEELLDVGIPKVAIVGRPNVGKSSLINALLNEERNIVTPIAGTTRDTINTHYKAYNQELLLIDTAGIRKKAKVREDIEFYSVMRSIKAIEECDVCVLMIDATTGIEAQDLNLLFLAVKNSKGVLILVNKWDLVAEKNANSTTQFEKAIKEKTAPFTDYPIVFISALNKQRIFKAVEKIVAVHTNLTKRITTSKLNEFLLPLITNYPPPATKGKYIRIKYVTQLKAKSVAFAFFCNLPQYLKEPYKRFLENNIRKEYDFQGVPIKIFFRKK